MRGNPVADQKFSTALLHCWRKSISFGGFFSPSGWARPGPARLGEVKRAVFGDVPLLLAVFGDVSQLPRKI